MRTQLLKYISRQFGNPSGIGGYISTYFMNMLNQAMYKSCESEVINARSSRVLDIGFGNGYMLKRLDHKVNAGFYGTDISPDMVKLARQRIKNENIILSQSNILHMDFPESFFDLIYTINTFYFWDDINASLLEVKNKLQPEGVFLNYCYTKKYLESLPSTQYGFTRLDKSAILELHQNAGFAKVEFIDIAKGKSFFIRCTR